MVKKLRKHIDFADWRKFPYLQQAFKILFKATNFAVFNGRKEVNKIAEVKKYLNSAKQGSIKIECLIFAI